MAQIISVDFPVQALVKAGFDMYKRIDIILLDDETVKFHQAQGDVKTLLRRRGIEQTEVKFY